MNVALRKAKEVSKKYGSDPFKICEEIGIEVLEVEMEGEVKEIFWGDAITLRKDLKEELKREYVAHAIGHHFLHAGSHYHFSKSSYSYSNYQEKQANIFAAYLLIPDEELEKEVQKEADIFHLSEKFNVTPQFVKFRLSLAKHYNPKKFNFLWR
jgi:Zn-dependent peptidase ImmA (M78 family)